EIKDGEEFEKILGIYYQDRLLGYAIPKRGSKKFLYISVGNNISLKTAKEVFVKVNLKLMNILKQKLNSFIQS
ncbi:MAG: endonuclease V, partial [Candidatus Thorarchaeota archaeon]